MRERCLLRILLCAVFGIFAQHLGAVEITGKVIAVNGNTPAARMEGELMPNAGDKVEIFFQLPGVEGDVSVATGSVSKVTGDAVEIKIDNATGEVAKDQLVRIRSMNPQKRTVSPTTDASPASPSVAVTPSSQPLSEHELLASKGDYDGAITLLNKVIALNSEDAQAFYQRAWCYAGKKAWDNVIADADKALALGYRDPGYAYLLRGQGRLGRLDFKGCIEDATKAIAIIPKFPTSYTLRAEATVRSGKWENVLEDCTTAIALLPNSVDAHLFRGYYYAHLGAMEAAEADWKKAIAINPANESVVKANRKIFEPTKKSSKKR